MWGGGGTPYFYYHLLEFKLKDAIAFQYTDGIRERKKIVVVLFIISIWLYIPCIYNNRILTGGYEYERWCRSHWGNGSYRHLQRCVDMHTYIWVTFHAKSLNGEWFEHQRGFEFASHYKLHQAVSVECGSRVRSREFGSWSSQTNDLYKFIFVTF